MLKVCQQRVTDSLPFTYQYYLSTPPAYLPDETKQWPLLLFLHGAGEACPPIEKVLRHGPPKLVDAYLFARDNAEIDRDSATFLAENFVTCSPQINEGRGWNSQVLSKLLDEVVHNYRIDRNKIYCTGISMGKKYVMTLHDVRSFVRFLAGGYGTWALALEEPQRFAAIIPICGGGDRRRVSALKSLPIWNFHGALDEVIPMAASIELVTALNSDLCKSTIYPDLKHDSWTRAYNNKQIYIWLLQQTRSN